MIKVNNPKLKYVFLFFILSSVTATYPMEWCKRCSKRFRPAIDFIQDRNPCKKQKDNKKDKLGERIHNDLLNEQLVLTLRFNFDPTKTTDPKVKKIIDDAGQTATCDIVRSLLDKKASIVDGYKNQMLGLARTIQIAQLLLTHEKAQKVLKKYGPEILARLSYEGSDPQIIPLYIKHGADCTGLTNGRTVFTQLAWHAESSTAADENDKKHTANENVGKLQQQAKYLIQAGVCLWSSEKKHPRKLEDFSFHQKMNYDMERAKKYSKLFIERFKMDEQSIIYSENGLRLKALYTFILQELKDRVIKINTIMIANCRMPATLCPLIHSYRDNEEYTKEEQKEVDKEAGKTAWGEAAQGDEASPGCA